MTSTRWSAALWAIGIGLLGFQALVMVRGVDRPAAAQDVKRFQYKIIEVLPDTQAMQSTMNEYGLTGWELVAVSVGDMTAPRLVFKK